MRWRWEMKKFCLIWVSVASIKILGIVQYRRLKRVFHGLFAIFLSHKMFYDKLKMWHPEAKLILPKLLDENLSVVEVAVDLFLSFDTVWGKCNFKSDWWDYNDVIECSNLQEICMNINANSRMVRCCFA